MAKEALTVTAVANVKTADGDETAAVLPSVTSGTIYVTGEGTDTANFHDAYDTSAAGDLKTLTPSGTVTDGNGGNNYSYNFLAQNNGRIRPGPAN